MEKDRSEVSPEQCAWRRGRPCMACLEQDKCSDWGEGGKFNWGSEVGVQSSALLAFE